MAAIKPWVLGAAAYVAVSGVCLADTLAARPGLSGSTIGFAPLQAYSNATLTVVGPNGFVARAVSKSGLPSLNLAQAGRLPDGEYTYQLSAGTAEVDTSGVLQNNGRANNALRPRKVASVSGTFLVRGGSIITAVSATALRGGSDRDQ